MVRPHNLNNNVHIAIIGGNGFVGRHLIHRLSKYSNLRIWSLDKQANYLCIDDTPFKAQLNQISMRVDSEDVIQSWLMAHPVDIVIYMAGYDNPTDGLGPSALKDVESLVALTKTVESLDKLPIRDDDTKPYFLYVSSAAIYGSNKKTPSKEGDKEYPGNHYGMARLLGEDIVKRNCTKCEVPFSIVRPTEIYGKRHYKELLDRTIWPGYLTYFIDQMSLQLENVDVFSHKSKVDLVNVNYVTQVIEKLTLDRIEGIFNIGSGHSITLAEMAEMVQELYGPDCVSKINHDKRMTLDNLQVDCSKTHQLVPYDFVEYDLKSFIVDYIRLRRFEIAEQKAIELFISQPLIVDLTHVEAKEQYIKRRKSKELAIRGIKEIAGDQFFNLKLGFLQEQAKELLPELSSADTIPNMIELPVTGELINQVESGDVETKTLEAPKNILDTRLKSVLPEVKIRQGKKKIDDILFNLQKK